MLAQEVPHPVKNTGVYDFIDELAGIGIVEINSAIKPYSRLLIAKKLSEAGSRRELLNRRQQNELDFYLKDFGKEAGMAGGTGQKRRSGFGGQWPKRRLDLFYREDSLFSITVNPVAGAEMFSNSSGRAAYWRNGVEARGYVGSWGFYASLRDNHEKNLFGKPEYLTQREGGVVKNGTEWSEMRGGITWSWKWGSAGLIKDALQWGTNYNMPNIFGGRNPAFTRINLNIRPAGWFEFNYFHGWLDSRVVDSTRSFNVANSYGVKYRKRYHSKYIAANMFTFTPFKRLNVSAGNSIVYDYDNVNAAYLIPLFFYKSIDHSQTMGVDNMNSQMFFDISSRQIRNLHLYGSLFVDELSVKRFKKNSEWNFLSYKAGLRLSNVPVKNLSLTAEFTYSYPLAYQHYLPTTTFETAYYNLGHYLKDNAREWYVALNYKPARALDINLFCTDAVRGPDYTELGADRVGNPPLATVAWRNSTAGIKTSYQVINDLYTWLSLSYSHISGDARWSPQYFYGYKTTLNAGFTMGF
jgi:hypothetical protein